MAGFLATWHVHPPYLSFIACSLHFLVAPLSFYFIIQQLIKLSSSSLFAFHHFLKNGINRLFVANVLSTSFFLIFMIFNIFLFSFVLSRASTYGWQNVNASLGGTGVSVCINGRIAKFDGYNLYSSLNRISCFRTPFYCVCDCF